MTGQGRSTELFGFSGDPEDVKRQLADLNEGLARQYEQARQATRAMEEMTATAESDGGAIRVTVRATGAVAGLVLGEQVRRWSAATLATKIVACAQRAQANLADTARDVMASTMSDGDNPMTRHVVDSLRRSFPAPADQSEPADPYRRHELRLDPDEDDTGQPLLQPVHDQRRPR